MLVGHWAALGLPRAPGAVCLDSSCVYGGVLTAMDLADDMLVREPLTDSVDDEGRG